MITALSMLAICVFAVTGVLAGGRKRMDITSILIVGMVTALGGGTLRDVMLGAGPVFWIHSMEYFWFALGASAAAFVLARFIPLPERLFLYVDAAGVALFCVLAAEKLLAAGQHPVISVIMGVTTGVAGGILRDLLLGDTPLLLRRDFYIAPTLLGTSFYVLCKCFFPAHPWDLLGGMGIIMATRSAAIRWNLYYPAFLLFRRKTDPQRPSEP